MRLPKFEYLQPTSIAEAVSMLHSNPAAKILAGGTDLLVNMKHRVEVPPVVVNIKMISDLDYIRHDNGAVRIGALTPLKRVYQTPFIAEKLPGAGQGGIVCRLFSSSDHGDSGRQSLSAKQMQILQSIPVVAKRPSDLF